MNKDKIWNIVLIISIILIIHGLTKTGSADKKEAQAGQGEATLGTIGTVGSFIAKKTVLPVFVWIAITIAGSLFLAPSIFTSWKNLFFPSSIPVWVYIAGFLVLFMMVTRK